MPFTLGLAQVYRPVERFAKQAAARNVDLLVFPEFLMTPLTGTPDEFRAAAQPLDGSFTRAVRAIAAANKLWIVFTMNERNDSSSSIAPAKPLNTAVVVDESGTLRGT